MEFLIVSGLSGGGKSRAADVLEDLDFYCVDNMPTALLTKFAELCLATRGRYEKVALVTDIRSQESFTELFDALGELADMGVDYRILFVEASESAIVRRYKESRRPHPLQAESRCSLPEAVRRESELLAPVRERADYVINTTGLTLSMLQKRICETLSTAARGAISSSTSWPSASSTASRSTPIWYLTCAFCRTRFMSKSSARSAAWTPRCRNMSCAATWRSSFLNKLTGMIDFLLPQYAAEGRYALTIGIGCTGGQHRSVAVAKALTDYLAARDANVRLRNRDFPRT